MCAVCEMLLGKLKMKTQLKASFNLAHYFQNGSWTRRFLMPQFSCSMGHTEPYRAPIGAA